MPLGRVLVKHTHSKHKAQCIPLFNGSESFNNGDKEELWVVSLFEGLIAWAVQEEDWGTRVGLPRCRLEGK